MTALDDALNEMLFEDFVEHFSPSSDKKLVIVDHHFQQEYEEQIGYRLLNGVSRTRKRPMSGGIIWRYYKTSKRFIWGGLKIPAIKSDKWLFYINSPGWGVAIKKFGLASPTLYDDVEVWFKEFAKKKPGKRWRDSL